MAATSKLTALEEYLTTSYPDGDREYVDGRIEERKLGTFEHGEVIALLAAWFVEHRKDWSITVSTDARMKATATRFRLPDVMVVDANAKERGIVTQPPLVAIEVLSPDDTKADYLIRIADFRMMGIVDIWVFDPDTCKAFTIGDDGSWQEAKRLISTERPSIYVDADSIFAGLS